MQFTRLSAALVRVLHPAPQKRRSAHFARARSVQRGVSGCQPRMSGESRNAHNPVRGLSGLTASNTIEISRFTTSSGNVQDILGSRC